VHADAAEAAELDERQDQRVVPRIEVEAQLDDRARLLEVVVRLLDCGNGRDLGEPRDRLRFEIQDHARGDVVDDDWPVALFGDRLEVRDDPSRRRLVVVRRDDEETVGAGLVRARREVDGVHGRIGAGTGDDRRAVADGVDRCRDQLDPLVVGERRRLARRAGDDEPVGAVLDEVRRQGTEALVVDRTGRVEGRHDRSQDLAEHEPILRRAAASPCRAPKHPQGVPRDPWWDSTSEGVTCL
jgi:hypothetical protein